MTKFQMLQTIEFRAFEFRKFGFACPVKLVLSYFVILRTTIRHEEILLNSAKIT
jgi:hypothetical protein